MERTDSKQLRRIAASYRQRALAERDRDKARVLAEIAADMEADAERLEGFWPKS